MNKKFITSILALALTAVVLLCGCSKKQEAYTQTAFCFDTAITLTVYDTPSRADEAQAILDEAVSMCEDYDNLLSRTKEGSDIYNINHANGEWTSVSSETVKLIYTAQNYCELTNGQIDITIAPVKDLWNFSPDTDDYYIPADSLLSSALSHVDYRQIEMEGSRIRLADAQAGIDLGFIAKGYIADQLKAFLISKDVENALINLGGNVLAIGNRPDGDAFKVGIQKPFADAGSYITTVLSADSTKGAYPSVVTSGTYERYFESGGKQYHHILDSATGYPVRTDLLSVTILSDSSTQGDGLSTTCLILGLEKGMDLINTFDGIEAIFLTDDYEIHKTY